MGLTRPKSEGCRMPVASATLIVTLIYIIALLSINIYEPQKAIWMAAYPVVASEMTGIGYGKLFLRSLWILPLMIVIGIFNPLLDTHTAFYVYGVNVSQGWVSFCSIILRGLLSMQALLLAVKANGLIDLFNSMRTIGCPAILTTQLLLTYRYLAVIIEEAIHMRRARTARGYGRKSYPLPMWGQFIGQLLLRSTMRARRIHNAMVARGFDGTLPTGSRHKWTVSDWAWMAGWCVVIAALRFIDFSSLFNNIAK